MVPCNFIDRVISIPSSLLHWLTLIRICPSLYSVPLTVDGTLERGLGPYDEKAHTAMFIYLLKYWSNIEMPTLAGALGQPYQQRCRQHWLRDRIPFPKGPDKNGILQKGAASSISPPPFICTDWKKYTAPCSEIKMLTAIILKLLLSHRRNPALVEPWRQVWQCSQASCIKALTATLRLNELG